MSAAVKGQPLEDVDATITRFKELMTARQSDLPSDDDVTDADLRRLGELAALQGVVKFPVRIKCATLAWSTLRQGLDELAASA